MQRLAGISLLLLLPWSVCTAAETLPTPDCELFYAVFPNPDAAGTVEKKVFETVSGLGREQRQAWSRTQGRRLEAILAISPGLAHKLSIRDTLITQGGYKGVSGISINARLDTAADTAAADIISLASMIGYIYFQDSVLILCDTPLAQGMYPAVMHTVSDAGSKDYLNPLSARLLFGMMMGYLNQVESVGYTYEQAGAVFRVLEFDRAAGPKRNALLSIAGHLAGLSDGKVKLDIRSADVVALSIGNKWKQYPQGGGYRSRFAGDVDAELIKSEQMRFIGELMGE